MSKITMAIETITPERASELLATNSHNRNIRPAAVTRLAAAIKRGEWKLNGDAIRIGSDGVLLDGQHRLTAIVRAGVPVQSIVVSGVSPDAFATIDTDACPRNAADVLHVSGAKSATAVASVAKMLHIYKATGNPVSTTATAMPTTQQVVASSSANTDVQDAVSWVYGRGKWCKTFLGPSISGFCRVLFMRDNRDAATTFFDSLNSGLDLHEGSPVALLREKMVSDYAAPTKMTKQLKMAMVFKAYKYHRDGASVKFLRVYLGDRKESEMFVL